MRLIAQPFHPRPRLALSSDAALRGLQDCTSISSANCIISIFKSRLFMGCRSSHSDIVCGICFVPTDRYLSYGAVYVAEALTGFDILLCAFYVVKELIFCKSRLLDISY